MFLVNIETRIKTNKEAVIPKIFASKSKGRAVLL